MNCDLIGADVVRCAVFGSRLSHLPATFVVTKIKHRTRRDDAINILYAFAKLLPGKPFKLHFELRAVAESAVRLSRTDPGWFIFVMSGALVVAADAKLTRVAD